MYTFLAIILSCVSLSIACGEETNKTVLVLHSYHQGLGWTDSITSGLTSVFKASPNPPVVQFEYMDTKRIADDQHLDNLLRLLAHKYRHRRIDAIIATDNSAYTFLLRHQPEIFPETPVVFCGVNNFNPQDIQGKSHITGVAETISIKETLDAALQLEPATGAVMVIIDDTDTGVANRQVLDALIPLYGNRLRFTYLTQLSIEELQERSQTFPADSIVLLLGFSRDSNGQTFALEESADRIARFCIRPIFSVWDFYFGHGLVGGMITSGTAHGEKAAALALRILNGELPFPPPVIDQSPNRYIFDYRLLEKFHLNRQRLPAGSQLINEPTSLYYQYKALIWQIAVVFVILTLAMVAVLTALIRRRVAERSLLRSEQRLRAIFQAAADISFVITDAADPEPHVLEFSPGAERIFGYTRDEMLGKPVSSLHLSETVHQFPTVHARMMQGEQGFSGETTLIRKNGEHFPALFAAYPLMNEQGVMWGALGVSVDITRQKKVEQALRESEERFKELAQLLPETIYEIALDGHILFLNQSGMQQFLLTEEDLRQGLNAFLFFPPREQQKLRENLAILASGKATGLSEYVVTRKDGSELPVMARSSPIIDHGAVVGVRGFLIDISEKKMLEEQLHLAQRMEAVGTLAGGIAHDFNNILMAIQGMSSLMQMGIAPDNPLTPQLQKIDDLVASAAGLTRQLLGFARAGKYNPLATNLNTMIAKTADMFGRAKKELRIVKRLDQELWTVCVDQGQIEQVLLNLMINAWQAMPNGGELSLASANSIVDTLESERIQLPPGRYVLVSVTDTGTGMDQETQQRIFEPFFTTKAKEFGTGLGLASAYGIINNHKGAITVQSEPGRGSTFTFYLPAVDAAAQETDLPAVQLQSGQANILLIDDEPFITEVESAILENLGHTVRICNSGEEALAYYRNHHRQVDLVILDIVMPGMSGEETFLGLRAINPEVKVLLASGYSVEGQAEKLLQMGCMGFMQKPFTSSLLSRKVMEIWRGEPAGADNAPSSKH